jgi:hypothetical protein
MNIDDNFFLKYRYKYLIDKWLRKKISSINIK